MVNVCYLMCDYENSDHSNEEGAWQVVAKAVVSQSTLTHHIFKIYFNIIFPCMTKALFRFSY
jgi:hypothetical protein